MKTTKAQRESLKLYEPDEIPANTIDDLCDDADLAERLEAENTELRNRLALISEITDKALQAVSEDSAR